MIREAKVGDSPALMKVASESGLFPPEHLEDLRTMLRGHFEAGEKAEGFWLLHEEQGECLGLAYSEPELMSTGTWNMRLVAVLPERQGRGLGRALVRATEKEVRKREGRLLLVDTSGLADFQYVRDFYENCGFEREALIKDFFEDGDDKVTFVKRVGQEVESLDWLPS